MKVRVDCLSDLSALSPAHWNHLVPDSNPFLRHEFLAGLEKTRCVGPRDTGWVPRHLVVRPEDQAAPIAALLLGLLAGACGEPEAPQWLTEYTEAKASCEVYKIGHLSGLNGGAATLKVSSAARAWVQPSAVESLIKCRPSSARAQISI